MASSPSTPVAAFYDTDFVIASQAIILATVQLLGAVWLWRRPRVWWGAVLLGLAAGASIVTRIEVLIIAPVASLFLIAIRRDWRVILQITLAAVLGLLVVVPAIVHNRRGGMDCFCVTPVIWENLYRCNNRDTQGTYAKTNAFWTTNRGNYPHYLKLDIQLDPIRFIELMLYKTSLFFSNHEPGSNLDYYKMGEGASRALALNPLNGPILVAAFFFGLAQLYRRRQFRHIHLLLNLYFCLFFSLFWWNTWLRASTCPSPFCIPPPLLTAIVSVHKAKSDRYLRRLILHSLPVLLAIGVFSIAIDWGASNLPNDPTVPELPAGASLQNLLYDDVLELVGWQIRDQYSPRNVMTPTHPWVVSF